MICAHCGVALVPETYEGITIDRCPSCQGVWLDAGELSHILETREVEISPEVVRETLALAASGVSQSERRTLIGCPQCQGPMDPINFDYTSGIVIDHCPLGHGNWLDAGELEQVQAHLEQSEDQEAQTRGDWLDFARSVVTRGRSVGDEARARDMRPAQYVVHRLLRSLTAGSS